MFMSPTKQTLLESSLQTLRQKLFHYFIQIRKICLMLVIEKILNHGSEIRTSQDEKRSMREKFLTYIMYSLFYILLMPGCYLLILFHLKIKMS